MEGWGSLLRAGSGPVKGRSLVLSQIVLMWQPWFNADMRYAVDGTRAAWRAYCTSATSMFDDRGSDSDLLADVHRLVQPLAASPESGRSVQRRRKKDTPTAAAAKPLSHHLSGEPVSGIRGAGKHICGLRHSICSSPPSFLCTLHVRFSAADLRASPMRSPGIRKACRGIGTSDMLA
jgi:hypothetical protein